MSSDNTDSQKQSKNPSMFDWMDYDILSRYVTETGKILPRKITRLSAKEQRRITKAIKRARNMLVMK